MGLTGFALKQSIVAKGGDAIHYNWNKYPSTQADYRNKSKWFKKMQTYLPVPISLIVPWYFLHK